MVGAEEVRAVVKGSGEREQHLERSARFEGDNGREVCDGQDCGHHPREDLRTEEGGGAEESSRGKEGRGAKGEERRRTRRIKEQERALNGGFEGVQQRGVDS